MHSDQIPLVDGNFGEAPRSWGGGPLGFQKAKVIAALAHHITNTDPAVPELPQCDSSFQETLTSIVEDIMRGSKPDNTPFALEAARLYEESKLADQPEGRING